MANDLSNPPPEPSICFHCGHKNPEPGFCSACGSPLALDAYIAKSVKEQVALLTIDRDLIEKESARRIFEKVVGWIKLASAPIVLAVVVIGGVGIWQFSDWRSAIAKVERAIADEASSVKDSAAQTRAQISQQTDSLKDDIANSRQQLQAAGQLEPQMEEMRQGLSKATEAIQAQQKVISSSEEFAKAIFSSHAAEFFWIGKSGKDRYEIIPPPAGGDRFVVVLLLDATPIPGTLQLQYHVFSQPLNSYFSLHNLVIFFWGQSREALEAQQLSVSYFADKSDKEQIKSLSERDGRVFADDEPLPKLNQPDPDFKGNRWLKLDQAGHITIVK